MTHVTIEILDPSIVKVEKKLHCDSGLFHSIQGLIFPQTQPITIWWIDLTSVKIGPKHSEGVV